MTQHIDFKVEKEAFFSEITDRQAYLVRGAVSPTLVSWANVNQALHAVTPTSPDVKVHRNGILPESEYLEDHSVVGVHKKRINRDALYGLLREGATLVLNRFDERFATLRELCAEVTEFTNAETLANGYVTFSTVGGFGMHWDTHDVLAIQLIGRKRWKVYEPTFSHPLLEQKSMHQRDEIPDTPTLDVVLEAGDMIYVPRGWWHNAIPIGETFHVAIGVHGPTMLDYISWLSQRVLRSKAAFRQSVRPGLEKSEEVKQVAQMMQEAMADPDLYALFLQDIGAHIRFNGPVEGFRIDTCGRPRVESPLDTV
jgi:ribosomal protein L16 Arg81 hydroxylase